MLSVIIPTYNEQNNILNVIELVGNALDKIDYEIIFIDDSSDNTPELLSQASEKNNRVRFEHRVHERGLGTAVVRGFQIALGDVLAVMDADLQHPPGMLINMLDEIQKGTDLVVPSRFIPGGSDGGLSLSRKLISATARNMSRLALHQVRKTTDPTSGFFMMQRHVIDNVQLKPIGWKILIEILVRGNYTNIKEIPYSFRARAAGVSKMSLREQWNYVKHLFLLMRDSPADRRFFLFAAVGISGVLVNLIIYIVLVRLEISVPVAGFVSALVALLTNFTLNDKLTWSEVRNSSWMIRLIKYIFTSIIGICIDVSVLTFLYHELHVHYVISNLVGILIATIWNYTVNNYWTWRITKRKITTSVPEQEAKQA